MNQLDKQFVYHDASARFTGNITYTTGFIITSSTGIINSSAHKSKL